jgi:WD40 repeat protein
VEFTQDGKHVIAIGKTKDLSTFNEETGDYEVLSGSVKIFDLLSGRLALSIEGHKQDVLGMKAVIFNGENYLLTCGQDGLIVKWHMSKSWNEKLGGVVLSPAGSGIAVSIDFVPQTGNKFVAISFDTGLKIYDFETHEVLY